MNAPEKLEVSVVVKDTDGNEHEVERLVYRLERNGKSRWAELFGTPERAARTLASIVTADGCEDCALLDATCSRHEDVWLEWLRGDAE